MSTVFECIMLACFGLSWPISVYKSLTSRSAKGKSGFFITAIIIGYIAGIISKLISHTINYVLALYVFNLAVVSVDLILFIINTKREQTIVSRPVN